MDNCALYKIILFILGAGAVVGQVFLYRSTKKEIDTIDNQKIFYEFNNAQLVIVIAYFLLILSFLVISRYSNVLDDDFFKVALFISFLSLIVALGTVIMAFKSSSTVNFLLKIGAFIPFFIMAFSDLVWTQVIPCVTLGSNII